jgi:hypothetical protein
MNEAFQEAIAQEVVWKNAELKRFATELVDRSAKLGEGAEFTTDIVPSVVRGSGPGIAGSVVELLKNANVIEPVGITQGGVWYPKRVKSTRRECKSRYLCVLRLKSMALARAFLKRNAEGRSQKEERYAEQELLTTVGN